jgi:subtilase family serine protease
MSQHNCFLRNLLLALLSFSTSGIAIGQTQVTPSRAIQQTDETQTVRVQGNVHPLARAEFDRGAAAQSQPMTRMLLVLQRSTGQETALRQLLDAQQTKSSASYHAWLTPEQFGKQFGPSDADVQSITDWLTKQGFQVAKVSAGRTTIEFNGTVAQVEKAFQTQIHHFVVKGSEHVANMSDPSIPEALSPVVGGVVALNNFPRHPMMHRVGSFRRDLATGQVKPLFTYTDMNGTFYGVGPADSAKIYNIPPGADGTGQSIAVVAQSNINIQDVQDFRTMFGLAANDPQIILNGPDPGIVGNQRIH